MGTTVPTLVWCDCESPDVDGGRDFGMCRRCLKKPHAACKVCPLASPADSLRDRQGELEAKRGAAS